MTPSDQDLARWRKALEKHPMLITLVEPLLASEADLGRVERAWARILPQVADGVVGRRGYMDSDLFCAHRGYLPFHAQICMPLVHSVDEFCALCTALPAIVLDLPYDTSDSPVGTLCSFDTAPLVARVKAAPDLGTFLASLGTP